jgi:hypothetical protein
MCTAVFAFKFCRRLFFDIFPFPLTTANRRFLGRAMRGIWSIFLFLPYNAPIISAHRTIFTPIGKAGQTQITAESKLFRSASPVGAWRILATIRYCIGTGATIFLFYCTFFNLSIPFLSPVFFSKDDNKMFLNFSFCFRTRLLILLYGTKRKKKRRRS